MTFLSHFGLTKQPFKITPDPEFIYRNQENRAAETVMQFGLVQMAPLTVVTGEVGVGKTSLIRKFLNEAPSDLTIGLISNFTSGSDDLYGWVLNAFGQDSTGTSVERYDAIERFLLAEYARGQRCLLLIDEAQAIGDGDLEQLRMLTNVNSGKDVLLMLFLVGQPELRTRLKQHENRQIAQRIGATAHIGPMSAGGTANYIRHRLRVAGARFEIFDQDALDLIHPVTGGIPRVTNIVCNLAMFDAYGEGKTRIDGKTMGAYLRDADENGYLAHLAGLTHPEKPIAPERPTSIITSSAPPSKRRVMAMAPRLNLVMEHQDELLISPSRLAPAAETIPLFKSSAMPAPANQPPKTDEAPAGVVSRVPKETAHKSPARAILPELRDPEPQQKISIAKPTRRRNGWITAAALIASGALYVGVVERSVIDMSWLFEQRSTGTSGGQDTAIAATDMASAAMMQPISSDLLTVEPAKLAELTNPNGTELISLGLEQGASDPGAAALAYARAALRGEQRAAYYLGQMYETGDGVPLNLELARTWYGFGDKPTRSARRRLEKLPDPAKEGALLAPIPLLGGPFDSAKGAEFVWASATNAPSTHYVVEITAAPGAQVQRVGQTSASAMLLTDFVAPEGAKLWRVLVIDPNSGKSIASDWHEMGMPNPHRP